MITAYVNGNEMGWLLTLLLLFFFVGGVSALAMLVIPEKYALSYGRGNIFVISSLFALVGIVGLAVCDSQTSSLDELDIGRHWEDDCSLIEIIMPEGTFTAAVNKLDCAGVVIHVPTETYNRHTSQWHMYSEKNK